jgi:hypothetical protein
MWSASLLAVEVVVSAMTKPIALLPVPLEAALATKSDDATNRSVTKVINLLKETAGKLDLRRCAPRARSSAS